MYNNRIVTRSNTTYKIPDEVRNDVKITVNVYFSPDCRYSRDFMANEWSRFKNYVRENLAESVQLKEINCLEQPAVCKKINTYPEIILERFNKRFQFRSVLTVDNLINFVEFYL